MPINCFVSLLSAFLSATALLLSANVAMAQVSLTWARVDLLQNRAQVISRGRTARAAQVADVLRVGDVLRTAAAARADLRFNDGSLARIGARALFQFTPNSRNFQLSNGTILLLIPPGQGRTTIQTPNTFTGVQGSALFVRYIPETHTTVVGALTDSPEGPMQVYNQDGSQQQVLHAGQLVSIVGSEVGPVFNFELQTFYQTSGLASDLSLDNPEALDDSEPLSGVRQEILEALKHQEALAGEGVIENPSFLIPPQVSELTPESSQTSVPIFLDSPAENFLVNPSPVAATGGISSSRDSGSSIETTPLTVETTPLIIGGESVPEISPVGAAALPSVQFESSVSATINADPSTSVLGQTETNLELSGSTTDLAGTTPEQSGATLPGQATAPSAQTGLIP